MRLIVRKKKEVEARLRDEVEDLKAYILKKQSKSVMMR